ARVPEAMFVMVIGDRGDAWAGLRAEVLNKGRQLPNVTVLPAITRTDLLPLYERAVAVLNTSHFEGFPNTFLEGWARGAPTLSLTVDPDGVLARGLGFCANGSLHA